MSRLNTIDEMIAVLQAIKSGKTVQYRGCYATDSNWMTSADSSGNLNFAMWEYRVKPEPREWWLVERNDRLPIGYYESERKAYWRSLEFDPVADVIHVREVLPE